jgi:hypothetical protein
VTPWAGRIADAYHRDRGLAPGLLAAPELPAAWRRWAASSTPPHAARASAARQSGGIHR